MGCVEEMERTWSDDHSAAGPEDQRAAAHERLALAQELHDELGQRLWALGLTVDRLATLVPQDVVGELEEVGEQLSALRADVRARMGRLSRSSLDGRSLAEALGDLARELVFRQVVLRVELPAGDPHADPRVEDQLWCVGLEAVMNAERHGMPRPIRVCWSVDAWGVGHLEVRNDTCEPGAPPTGVGLRSMRRRVEALGGELFAGPVAGGGWSVEAHVPRARARTGVVPEDGAVTGAG